jgi:hypothetical protein
MTFLRKKGLVVANQTFLLQLPGLNRCRIGDPDLGSVI